MISVQSLFLQALTPAGLLLTAFLVPTACGSGDGGADGLGGNAGADAGSGGSGPAVSPGPSLTAVTAVSVPAEEYTGEFTILTSDYFLPDGMKPIMMVDRQLYFRTDAPRSLGEVDPRIAAQGARFPTCFESEILDEYALDSSGNIYLGHALELPGASNVHASAILDVELNKYSPEGETEWVKSFGGNADSSVVATHIEAHDDYVYVTGGGAGKVPFLGDPEETGDFVGRFTSDGDVEWVVELPERSVFDGTNGVAVSSSGAAYVAGAHAWCKVTAAGAVAWCSDDSRDFTSVAQAGDAAFLANGTGSVFRFDLESDQLRWGVDFSNYEAEFAVSANGNSVFVFGQRSHRYEAGEGAGHGLGFVARLDLDGNLIWIRHFALDPSEGSTRAGEIEDLIEEDDTYWRVHPEFVVERSDGIVGVVAYVTSTYTNDPVSFLLDLDTGELLDNPTWTEADFTVPADFEAICADDLPAVCTEDPGALPAEVTDAYEEGDVPVAPAGGALVSGTYHLVSHELYNSTCGTDQHVAAQVLSVTAESESSGVISWRANFDGNEQSGAYAYNLEGTTFIQTAVCDDSSIDEDRQYTATESTLTLFHLKTVYNSLCDDNVLTYQKAD